MTGEKEYSLRSYKCGYCGYSFKHYVRSTGGQEDFMGRKGKKYSSQVKCQRCSNFLKTWEEGKDLGIYKAKRISNRVSN
jgi:hypothetical protein